ncbi:hypothetical protein ABZ860_23625 [Microbispora sp. NPDC046973]|uniref:hypothetical protein n=1 Tax=Microbispora sp. NPDC046973 TaxID=3155022 RepID=UPI0033DDB7C8
MTAGGIDYQSLARSRANGMVNYIALLIALARDTGRSAEDLAQWVQRPYEELGLYAELARLPAEERLKLAAERFATGRRLLYDEVDVTELADRPGYRIRSLVWYADRQLETAALFGVAIEEIRSYAALLATRQLSLQGIRAVVTPAGSYEIAELTPDDTEGA